VVHVVGTKRHDATITMDLGIDVRGTVTDKRGNPLAGVSVRSYPADKNVQSDADGRFHMEGVPAHDIRFQFWRADGVLGDSDTITADEATSGKWVAKVGRSHMLTWDVYEGQGDPEKAVYFLDGERMGEGVAGLQSVRERIARLPRGEEMQIYPHFSGLRQAGRPYPFSADDLSRFAAEHGITLNIPKSD
jgi:hypothetical protein